MRRLRVGFVGAGGIAHRHLGVLATMDDVEVAGVADPDEARARDAAQRAGAAAFTSHDDMLAALDLDALWICVPPFAHGSPERAAIAAGLPFLVEKPLSLDAALAREIDAAVRAAGLVTAVGYHWRYLDTVDEARRRLADNPAHLMSGYWLDQTPPPQWWGREDRSGGQMVEQATHVIDLARFLAGDVVEVYGLAARRPRDDHPGLDVATASTAALRFASGAIANLSATCLLRWTHRVGLHVFADGMALEITDRELTIDVGHGRPVRAPTAIRCGGSTAPFSTRSAARRTASAPPTPRRCRHTSSRSPSPNPPAPGRPSEWRGCGPTRSRHFAPRLGRAPVSPNAHRTIRSLGVERPGEPYYAEYVEGPAGAGEVRLDLLYTGLSAGTELTFLKGVNPYLHARWDEERGVFAPGEPSVRYPVPFMGYMEVAEVVSSDAPSFAPGDRLAATFGHKTGHVANPAHDLLVPLPRDLDPILGVFVAQMGPICANGILHADAEALGRPGFPLGTGVAGRPVVVWGGGTVGLLTALFARRAGAEVLMAEPSDWRRGIAGRLGFEAFPEEDAWAEAKRRWRGADGRGADFVFQTRAHAGSLGLALKALRPQGTVIDLAFYQGGLDAVRLGEAFHHNGLAIRCAQIARAPRGFGALWDRRRLASETLALLRAEGDAIRANLITHVVPFDEAADFLRRLPVERPDFLQIVFAR